MRIRKITNFSGSAGIGCADNRDRAGRKNCIYAIDKMFYIFSMPLSVLPTGAVPLHLVRVRLGLHTGAVPLHLAHCERSLLAAGLKRAPRDTESIHATEQGAKGY